MHNDVARARSVKTGKGDNINLSADVSLIVEMAGFYTISVGEDDIV